MIMMMIDLVSLDMSSRCLNERNFQQVVNALGESCLRVDSLDLSFNQFFKDQSLNELLTFMETKSISILDNKCKLATDDAPIIRCLK